MNHHISIESILWDKRGCYVESLMETENSDMVENLTLDRRSLQLQIEDFVRQILVALSQGKLPSVSIAKYRARSCRCEGGRCGIYEKLGIEHNLSLQWRTGGARRLVVMLRVLGIVQQLLKQEKHASKRDIYYSDPLIFQDTRTIDQAINDICIRFQCSRNSLHVVSASKGLVMGWISYFDSETKIDCMKHSCCGYPIPVHTNLVRNIKSLAEYILLVEKETVFQRLANDGFCARNHCIVLSGKGYPDVPTRRLEEYVMETTHSLIMLVLHRLVHNVKMYHEKFYCISCSIYNFFSPGNSFLRLLRDTLELPVYGLVDGDPHGLDILLTYRFGSLTMAYDAEALATPDIHWLGILLSDCETFDVPKNCLLPLNTRDRQKANAILKRRYLEYCVPSWSEQIENMLHQGVKLEVEAISAVSFSFLTQYYLPLKIQNASYLYKNDTWNIIK